MTVLLINAMLLTPLIFKRRKDDLKKREDFICYAVVIHS
ncbi:MAG: hypothetical protein ACJA0N_002749 [Pseudohongiellaceae bacterium]|jgi:hypothetical protein